MKNKYYLGIDTSNYTTSLALVGEGGEQIANLRRLLPVKEGARGLRQSDALFFHTKALPDLLSELAPSLDGGEIAAVGVSTRPRNVEGSYMPCFLAGVSVASAISSALRVPTYSFSHQCGHLMAALTSCETPELFEGVKFGAFHVSGGTSELLSVREDEGGFQAICVGGTRDLNAGQVIDRVGVAMGLPFPAGRHLDALASQNTKPIPHKKPPVLDGCYTHFSGLENMTISLWKESGDSALVAAFLFDYIAKALLALACAFRSEHGERPLLFAGGVMSNSHIRATLSRALSDIAFATPTLSSDNAVGIAELARRAAQGKE